MGYCHMFYGLDLERLRSIAGSGDAAICDQILAGEHELEDDELDALRRIVNGDIKSEPGTEHLYGYALKTLCEHIGEMVGEDVAAIRDHPYKSKLIANGAPIAIPVNPGDFPQIGYLSRIELSAEHELVKKTKPRAKRTLVGFILRRLTGGAVGREMDAEDVAEDMRSYAETLQECIDKNCDLVSFRH